MGLKEHFNIGFMIKSLLMSLMIVLFCCHYTHAENLQSPGSIDYQNITELNTAINADYLKSLEKDIIFEMNKARTNPKKYAELEMKPMLKRFIGKKYFNNNKNYLTTEGKSAVEECLIYLNNTKSSGLLYPDEDLSKAAMAHVKEQGHTGRIGHLSGNQDTLMSRVIKYAKSNYASIGENISYGLTSAPDIVSFLLINDGMPLRKHRENLMNTKFNLVGVSCGYHKVYRIMCVIVYGGL